MSNNISNDILKGLQEHELKILKKFCEICQKNKLTYYLAFGTLIGAIRHHGFIPWDDDIDVMMPYKDYVRFQKIAKRELGEKYFLQSHKTDIEFNHCYLKIRENNTTLIVKDVQNCEINHGISIDVYPLVNLADGKMKRMFQYFNAIVYILLEYDRPPANHGKLLYYTSKLVLSLIPKSKKKTIKDKCFSSMVKYSNNKTKYCFAVSGSPIDLKIKYKSKWFATPFLMDFEDGKFYVPNGYDMVLRTVFGDYMKLPPEEERSFKLGNIIKVDFENSYLQYKNLLYGHDIK